MTEECFFSTHMHLAQEVIVAELGSELHLNLGTVTRYLVFELCVGLLDISGIMNLGR